MTVDEKLRETLARRASSVEPPLGGWAEITRRIQRRQRRARAATLSLIAGVSVTAVAVVVLMATLPVPGNEGQDVAATGGATEARVSTSVAYPFDTPTTIAPTAAASPGPVVATTGEGGGAPSDTIAPDPPGPVDTGMAAAGFYTGTIYPETAASLENTQVQVAAGHQPWWLDPAMVASSYLANRGLTVSEEGAPRRLADQGDLRYTTAAGVGGWVSVSQLGDGSIFYVTGSRTDRIVRLRATRQGDRVAVEVLPAEGGRVVVRTKRPDHDWNPSATQEVVAGRPASLSVEGPGSTELIVQVRYEGDGGEVGLTEQRLARGQPELEYDGLHDGSELHAAGLGPVSIGFDLATTQQMAGIAMTGERTGPCIGVSPTGRPQGVSFLSTDGDDVVDVLVVSAPSVHTSAGIGVGSTAADVRRAYPGVEDRLVGGTGRLVYNAEAPMERFGMVFHVTDGTVQAIWSGPIAVSRIDEICA